MNTILYCVLHTIKNLDRFYSINKTWGHTKDVLFFSDYIGPNVIRTSESSDYHSNEEKQINGIKYLSSYQQYEWYCFCDDDTFINTALLEKEIMHMNTGCVHGQIINCYPQHKNLYYLSGGAGFIMHQNIIHQLYSNIKRNNIPFADVSFGLNYQKLKIKIQNNNLFHSQKPSFYNYEDNDINKNISFHYIVTNQEMQRLYDLCRQ